MAMILLCFAIFLIASALFYIKWQFSYWKRKNVPHMKATSIWGNLESPFTRKEFHGVIFAEIYSKLKANGEKHGGFYNIWSPQYMPLDPEIIRLILEKDFDNFYDRGFYCNEKDDPLSAHLLAVSGQKWKTLRSKLTPTFTRAKIKTMFEVMVQCGEQMTNALDEFASRSESIDVKDVVSRFTMDTIASCAMGMESNSFTNQTCEFYQDVYEGINEFTPLRWMFFSIGTNLPHLARKLGIKIVGDKYGKIFLQVARTTIEHRKTNNIRRNDAFQALIDLGDVLTIEEIGAQCLIFLLAGFETSSSTLTYALYELSKNIAVQKKARDEILAVLGKYNGKFTYESMEEMHYLGQIIDETLRKYPVAASLSRVCTKDYKLPNSDLTIEKDTKIVVSVLGLHSDEEYFPDPKKFDPDRFSEENKKKLKPYTYMPFGKGPRMCIGKRFGFMEIKIALSLLLKDYCIEVTPKTADPLRWKTLAVTLMSAEPIYLSVKKVVH